MKLILVVIGFLNFCSLCGQNGYYPSDHSYLDQNRYSNEYFRFEMQILNNWNILNQDQIQNSINSRLKSLQTDFNIQLDKDKIERIRREDLILLLLSKTNSIQDLPNFMISWEPIQSNSQILTSSQYLNGYIKHSQQNYFSSGINIRSQDLVELKIDQIVFTELQLELSYQGEIYAYQTIYCTVINGCFFKIMTNFESNSQKELCKKQIQMIEFK